MLGSHEFGIEEHPLRRLVSEYISVLDRTMKIGVVVLGTHNTLHAVVIWISFDMRPIGWLYRSTGFDESLGADMIEPVLDVLDLLVVGAGVRSDESASDG